MIAAHAKSSFTGKERGLALDATVAFLNEILAADPDAVSRIFLSRTTANAALIAHPRAMVAQVAQGRYEAGALGIVNALYGGSAITMVFDSRGGRNRIVRFARTGTDESRPDAERAARSNVQYVAGGTEPLPPAVVESKPLVEDPPEPDPSSPGPAPRVRRSPSTGAYSGKSKDAPPSARARRS